MVLTIDLRLETVTQFAFPAIARFDGYPPIAVTEHLLQSGKVTRVGFSIGRRHESPAFVQLTAGNFQTLAQSSPVVVSLRQFRRRVRDCLLYGGKLCLQRAKDIGTVFELPSLNFKRVYFDGQGLPIEIAKALEHGQLLQSPEPAVERDLTTLQLR